jgi:hypothetical protein
VEAKSFPVTSVRIRASVPMPTAGIELGTSVLRAGLHQGLDLGVDGVPGSTQLGEHPGQLGQHRVIELAAIAAQGHGVVLALAPRIVDDWGSGDHAVAFQAAAPTGR